SEEYCRHWNDGSSTNTVNISIQNNVGMIPHHGSSDVWVEDLNGFLVRDDVNLDFATLDTIHFTGLFAGIFQTFTS
ncbi:MAG: hypothetical protein ABI169_08145, partial [Chitinophagaceae bacterium]